jgi:LCP family protein required for cell wall assembly
VIPQQRRRDPQPTGQADGVPGRDAAADPVADALVAGPPVVNAPVADALVADAPARDSTEEAAEALAEPAATDERAVDDAVADDVVAEEPVADDVVTEEPAAGGGPAIAAASESGTDPAAEAEPQADSEPQSDSEPQAGPGSGAGAGAGVAVEVPVVRRRSPLWAKTLIALGTVLVLLSAGTVFTLHVLAGRYDKSVQKAELIDPGARVHPTADDDGGLSVPFVPQGVTGPLNFLLIGSDARDNNPGMGERSDTIILLHIPATLDKAYLISIPRDLRVKIPADPATGYRGGRGKINGAFNFGGGGTGGFQLLSKTLNQLTNLKFDGAAIINFDGFQNAVHLLGGVNLCVDQVTKSIHTGTVYQVGCQHLGAVQALDYVRQRELLPEGDYDRQRHQQQFLKAILQEAINKGVATNPIQLDQLIRAIGSALTVDTNGVPLSDLVFGLKGISPSSLVGIKLPSNPQTIGGISYVVADSHATSLYQAIASDTLDDWVAANPSWVNAI